MESNRFYRHFYQSFTLLPCLYSFVIFTVCINNGVGENSTKTIKRYLPNEVCTLRETLVHVDKLDHKFYPLVVKLHRCEGACYQFPPSLKKCVARTYDTVELRVRRMHDRQRDIIRLQNHTSCSCPCTENENSCDKQTQTWNERFCRCECKPGAKRHICYPPFKWNVRTCRCKCNIQCNERQDFDKQNCMCPCKQKHYETCMRSNKIIDANTCRCLPNGGRSTGKTACQGISTKWAVVLIFMGLFLLLVLLFDCVLYGKKTGIFFKIVSACHKTKREPEERSHCISLQKDDCRG